MKIKNQPNLAAHRQGYMVIGLHIGKCLGNPITLSMWKLSQVFFLSKLFSRTDGKVLSGSWHIHDWVSLLVLGGSSHLVSKWLIAMVIVSPQGDVPLTNGLNSVKIGLATRVSMEVIVTS